MKEIIKVFKGTNKDMKCRGMQYELGETKKDDGAIRCGNKGFHSCEAPFDVLRYYPIRDGNRFFEAEAGGIIDRNLAGGADSNLAGGVRSNLAGGASSIIVCRNGCKAKGGKNSVIVFTEWDWRDDDYVPICVKTVIVDGEKIKSDVFYRLRNGEVVEAE